MNATIVKSKSTGARFLKCADGRIIPIEIAALAAGKDAWMRNVSCKCQYCRGETTVHGWDSLAGVCEKCQTEMEEENARADGY